MSPIKRIAIRGGYILAFDGRGHRLLRDGVVVVEGDHILAVGPRFDGTVDETVDARDRVVTPGLISTHAHIGSSPPTSASASTWAWPSAPGAGSRGTASARSGSGTRSRAARASGARWSFTRGTMEPTEVSCAASSRRPRSTPAPRLS